MKSEMKLLTEFLNAFNRHDLDRIMEFFADDCVLEMPRGPEPFGQRFHGKADVRAALETRFAGIPDVQYLDDEHWAFENHAVSKWRLTGTSTQGKTLNVHGCDLLDLKNGQIAKKDSYWKIVEG